MSQELYEDPNADLIEALLCDDREKSVNKNQHQTLLCDSEVVALLQSMAERLDNNTRLMNQNHQNNIKILKKLDSIEEKLEEMAKRQLSAWLESVKKFKEKLKNAKTPQEEAIYAQALKESMPQEGELDTIIEDAFPEEKIRNIVHEQLKMLGKNIGDSFDVTVESIGDTQKLIVKEDDRNHNRYVALADRLDSIEALIRSIDSEVSKTYHVVNAMPRDHY